MDLGFLGGFKFLGATYQSLPFRISRAFEIDGDAVETYRLNINDEIEVCDLTQQTMDSLPGSDVLLGGFPCQDFSSCGPKTGFEGKHD